MGTPGRPTNYKPEYCELGHNYCLLGATNEELADFFGVSRGTIQNWIATYPDFAKALNEGREVVDATVAKRLLSRALGFSHTGTRTLVYRGQPVVVDHTVHYPPDVQACIFWLRNRRRQNWRERVEPAPDDRDDSEDWVRALDAAGESMRDK